MEATKCLKCPFLITRDTSPSRADLEVFMSSPSDGCPVTAPYVASTQAMRSRRVSSASKSPDCVVAHRSDWCSPPVRPIPTGQTGQTHRSDRSDRSDRSGAAAAPSSVLRSWLCGSTKEPSGFVVNHRKPRELGVASANLHSWLGSHVIPARPWFWGSTKKPSMTSSCCSCHHAARTWPRWPPGPSNEAYLSSPHLEASPATTFRACSWPAQTSVKPQPAPAILSQESVHTTLSITHHTRKWPSTGPRTTHGPQYWIHREKGRESGLRYITNPWKAIKELDRKKGRENFRII
jgi:hypothetical protein